ncbi:hypothetical protein Cgig2_032078 [Carnegiea gigantea]|uniref:COP1-interacting protein 7 n=1 Tax=Carnegiea gigantea TaxID=171969 RepID=A0A9Q1JZH7_9CARY|nr:hypothetical protein Cgig2_032078 [Carnegiea gigantea]
MRAEIAADAPLDYVTFQILQENRYNVFINSNENEEMVGHGLLDQLLDHLPNIKDQLASEPCDNFKLELQDNAYKRAWFTKATFLHIVGSSELEESVNVSNEISQLKETRKFHLSLYAKAEDGITSSDNSKNELLRAMDTRIAALMEELVSTFNSVAGGIFSSQEMVDLQEFCQHFADVDISNLLSKLPKTSQKGQIVAPSEDKKSAISFISSDVYTNKTDGKNQVSDSSNSVEAVEYNTSLAKAAEIERQSSTESEDLSFSSEDEQPCIESCRAFIRSTSPRRSASPLRRIQVRRSGPHRTHALTMKSLTCFPASETISLHGEMGNDCQSEGSAEPDKKTEVNVMRISVQDAISLFEGKQKNQTVDSQKRRSFIGTSTNTNKTVLRRWSSGKGEPHKFMTQSLSDQTASEDNPELVDEDAWMNEEVKPEKGPASENQVSETVKVNMESEMSEKTANLNSDNVRASEAEITCEKLDSDEWGRQKEEELNQMPRNFAEHNQTNLKIAEPDSSKNCKPRLERMIGTDGQYKEKRDAKLKEESAGKRVEKQSEFRAKMKKVQEKQEAEKSSVTVNDGVKKKTTGRARIIEKNEPVALNSEKESPGPAEPKKIPSKKSSGLPSMRKSWPSMPSPRGTGTLRQKAPAGAISSGTKAPPQKSQLPAPRQRTQSPGPLSRPSPKVERWQIQHKDIKKPQVDTKKNSNKVEDGKNQVVQMAAKEEIKSIKITKTRNVRSEEDANRSPAKAVVHKRVTKKSSVVPLEAKPSPSKGSDLIHSVEEDSTTSKAETPAQVGETLSKCEDPINIQENAGATMSDTVYLGEGDPALETHNGHVELEKEIDTEKPNGGGEKEISDEIPSECDEVAKRMPESTAQIHPVQEPLISPTAWEESAHQDPSIPTVNISLQSPPAHDTVAPSEPRIRHSLSRMLLKESTEPDVIEWGNAENPPPMVYQKDAPKGLKRFLTFSRKNKGETNGAAWASPYTSEGEDDGDEYRALGKRGSDNPLRQVASHSKSYTEGVPSDSELLSAQSISNRPGRSSNKFQEGHGTTKGYFCVAQHT